MIESVLVANRGEIARRIIRTAKRLGIRAIAVYSEADADLPFVLEADEAVLIGPANPAESYRNTQAILDAAKKTGANPRHAPTAILRLRRSIGLRGPANARNRTLDMVSLAEGLLAAGEIDESRKVTAQATEQIDQLASNRLSRRLNELRQRIG